MYAVYSQYSNSVPLSNNSAIAWQGSYYTTFSLYCMSNASNTSAYLIYHKNSGNHLVFHPNCGTGCYELSYYGYYGSSLSSSDQGIYTCRIQDSRGIYLDVSVGIYPDGFNCKHCAALIATSLCMSLCNLFSSATPVVTSLQQTASTSQFTLTCTSTTSPATTVVWTKDGTDLTMDGAPYQHSQVVTDRSSSTYKNILTSAEDPDSGFGNYTCTVSNRFGSSIRSAVIGGWFRV